MVLSGRTDPYQKKSIVVRKPVSLLVKQKPNPVAVKMDEHEPYCGSTVPSQKVHGVLPISDPSRVSAGSLSLLSSVEIWEVEAFVLSHCTRQT